jgi:riboflavin biosynthesis pyrimidine reductase
VHRLFPPPVLEVEVDDIYREDRPPLANRPWLMINMISTVDNVTEVEGVSGPLGSPGDKDIFSAVRALPDIILVGSTTAVAERYNPPSTSVSTKTRRLTSGAWPVARIAVVSARLDFDLTLPMFTRPSQRPIVVTTTNADPIKIERVADVADLIQCGIDSVDLPEALHQMTDLGAQRVLCEGGPSLNGALLDAGLIDEVFVTVAPLLGGGQSRGIAQGNSIPQIQELELRHVLTEDHFLFLRYTRATHTEATR